MPKKPDFDQQAAHKYFSAGCFNAAWDLIDKVDRTSEEDEDLIRLSIASQWHWTQREDYSDTNASIAYWQISRVYAILGEVENARKYGQLCLEASRGEDVAPFFLGYAYEALARAESVSGDKDKIDDFLTKARDTAQQVKKADERKMLEDDLDTIL